MLQHKTLSLKKEKYLFYTDELFTQHMCNILAGRTAVIWGYPTRFLTRYWKPQLEILKPYCIVASLGKLKKLPLLRPRPNLGVMGLRQQYVLFLFYFCFIFPFLLVRGQLLYNIVVVFAIH